MKKEITVDNIKIEVLSQGESARYLGQKITFEEEEIEETKNRLKNSVGSVPQISPRTDHERLPTVPQTTSVQHGHHANADIRKWNVDVITKTRKDYQDRATKDASPHCTKKKKIQIDKQKRNTRWDSGGDEKYEEEKKCATDKETEEGSDQNSDKDQDSDVSFQEEIDEEIDATEKEEDWIEYIKISTKEAEEHMEKYKIRCWIEIHRRLKWRMTRRIVSLPDKRWTRRVFDWPGLDNSIRTRRQVGRPKRRWEDDFNEFLKTDETQAKTKYDLMNNNSWMMEAKKYKEWKEKEEKFVDIW